MCALGTCRELANHPEGEIREMVDIYISKGMTESDAQVCAVGGCREMCVLGLLADFIVVAAWMQNVVRTMAKYHSLFIDVMMQEELGLHPPDETEADLFKEGGDCCVACVSASRKFWF